MYDMQYSMSKCINIYRYRLQIILSSECALPYKEVLPIACLLF